MFEKLLGYDIDSAMIGFGIYFIFFQPSCEKVSFIFYLSDLNNCVSDTCPLFLKDCLASKLSVFCSNRLGSLYTVESIWANELDR